MTNLDVLAIREFRRFINNYIYPEKNNLLIQSIAEKFLPTEISYESVPQAIIKFNEHISMVKDNNAIYTEMIHTNLKVIFVAFFNDPEIEKLIRNKIHLVAGGDLQLRNQLSLALLRIQFADIQYLSLLFNITILQDKIYLYL